MCCINQLIAETFRWQQCTVVQILSISKFNQQLANNYLVSLQINVLRDNNKVLKHAVKLSVSVSCTHNPTLNKTEETFMLRSFNFCHANRLVCQSVGFGDAASSEHSVNAQMPLH